MYFIPTVVAFYRDRMNKLFILIVNIFLALTGLIWAGLIFIGWIGLLIWAFSVDTETLYKLRNEPKYKRRTSFSKKQCPKCDEIIDSDYNSCPKCGERFVEKKTFIINKIQNTETWTCDKCGDRNAINSITCMGCGEYRSKKSKKE